MLIGLWTLVCLHAAEAPHLPGERGQGQIKSNRDLLKSKKTTEIFSTRIVSISSTPVNPPRKAVTRSFHS